MSKNAVDAHSFLRFATDALLYRVLRFVRLPSIDRERQIRLRGEVRLTYRLNRGDITSIREVWLDEAYQLPSTAKSDVLIDLGANIGLTSVWLAKRYGYSTIIAVEPSPTNARLAQTNLENNGIAAEIIEAAVGPTDGSAFFEDHEVSTYGRVNSGGRLVPMLSMQSVFRKLPIGSSVDLVKLDIEGGEEALLEGDLSWLEHVQGIIAEFHPSVVDYPRMIKILQDAGFHYIVAGSAHSGSMDTFIRHT